MDAALLEARFTRTGCVSQKRLSLFVGCIDTFGGSGSGRTNFVAHGGPALFDIVGHRSRGFLGRSLRSRRRIVCLRPDLIFDALRGLGARL